MPLTLLEFVRKWNASLLTERSSSQQHFRDLCEAIGVQHPTEVDEIGNAYCFDKRVTKLSGGEGFADVWKRGYFAWEYKTKGNDLKAAYRQLSNYHEALENPPLLVVCDFVRFEVHTKFENLPTRVYAFTLDDLLKNKDTPTCALPPVEVLRAVFTDYNELRPERTAARVTRAAASDLLRLAERLELESRPTPLSREQIAHFLMRIVFCLFADSIGLLPEHIFRTLLHSDDRFLPPGSAASSGFSSRRCRKRTASSALSVFATSTAASSTMTPSLTWTFPTWPSSPPQPVTTGRSLNPPSLAPCSSVRSTPPSALSSEPTTPARKTSFS